MNLTEGHQKILEIVVEKESHFKDKVVGEMLYRMLTSDRHKNIVGHQILGTVPHLVMAHHKIAQVIQEA